MRATLGVSALKDALAFATSALPARSPVPALMGIRIDVTDSVMTLGTFDFDTHSSAVVPIAGGEDGSVLIAGRLFGEVVRGLASGDMTLTADDQSVKVVSGRSSSRFGRMDLADYPSFPEIPPELGEIDATAFAAAVMRCAPVTLKDATKSELLALLSVRLEAENGTLHIVGMDGYRIGHAELPWHGADTQMLFPAKALMAAVRPLAAAGGTVTLTGNDNLIGLSSPGRTMVTRQIQAAYPKWGAFMNGQPTPVTTATFDCDDLAAAFDRVGKFLADPTTPLKLEFTAEQVFVSSPDATHGAGSEDVDCLTEGEPQTIWVGRTYFGEALKHMGAGKVTLDATTPTKPMILSHEEPGYEHMVMPVRAPAGMR